MIKVFKKPMAIILSAIMIAGLAVVGVPAQEVEASYTLITTADEFNNIRNNMSGDYKLGANIDLSGYSQWVEIGTSLTQSFKGTLDGDGHTISGLSFGGKIETDYGLFGYTNGATIENLNIILAAGTTTGTTSNRKGVLAGSLYNSDVNNVHIDGNGGTIVGGDYVGGLAGVLNGSVVTNSSVSNIIIKANSSYSGGFIGVAYSDACGNYKTITLEGNNVKDVNVTSGTDHAGGFVGYTYDPTGVTTYRDCHVENVNVNTKSSYAGGFAGKVYQKHLFEDCTVTNANVESSKLSYAGGFVGYAYGPGTQTQTMLDCQVLDASVKAISIVGGFAGMFGSTTSSADAYNIAEGCYALDVDVTATHTGAKGNYAGGWAGKIWRSQVSESCAMGTTVQAVSPTSGYSVGGFVGEMANNASTTDCYAEFDSVSGMKWVGGFCGYLSGTGTNTIKNTHGVAKINTTHSEPESGSHTGFSSGGTFQGTNYYDNQVSDLGAAGTTYSGHIQGYDTATMKKQATFVGWNFEDIWRIEETITYPYFWKQSRPTSEQPTIDIGKAGDTSVSGTGTPGATVTVVVDDKTYTAVVQDNETWRVDVDNPLVADQVVSATQTEDGKRESSKNEMTVIGYDTTVRGVVYSAINNSGATNAVSGDTISVPGTVIAGINRWSSPVVEIQFANRVNLDVSTITIAGAAAEAGYDYEYSASSRTLTLYMGAISAGNVEEFLFDVNVTGAFEADLADNIITSVRYF
ncbi:MAG: ZmpA/ZmpB/ZmpC family metallo-endopeptidase-related protein [Suipraeoptans sp.]